MTQNFALHNTTRLCRLKQTNGVQCKKQKNKLKNLFGKISLYAVQGNGFGRNF